MGWGEVDWLSSLAKWLVLPGNPETRRRGDGEIQWRKYESDKRGYEQGDDQERIMEEGSGATLVAGQQGCNRLKDSHDRGGGGAREGPRTQG